MKQGLNKYVIIGVGFVVCILAGTLIWTLMIQNTQNQIADAQTRINQAGDVSPAAEQAADKQLTQAKTQVAMVSEQWGRKQAELMPPYDVSNRFKAWQQISYELEQYLGPDIERWVPSTGVTLLSSVSIAPPPPNPNSITNAPLVIPIGGGSVEVGGSFRKILAHILRWNNFNRLVLINNLELTGTSPNMAGTYNAQVIIFPQNDDKLGPAIPAAGGGAGFGGGGGYGGGGGGGPQGFGIPTNLGGAPPPPPPPPGR